MVVVSDPAAAKQLLVDTPLPKDPALMHSYNAVCSARSIGGQRWGAALQCRPVQRLGGAALGGRPGRQCWEAHTSFLQLTPSFPLLPFSFPPDADAAPTLPAKPPHTSLQQLKVEGDTQVPGTRLLRLPGVWGEGAPLVPLAVVPLAIVPWVVVPLSEVPLAIVPLVVMPLAAVPLAEVPLVVVPLELH